MPLEAPVTTARGLFEVVSMSARASRGARPSSTAGGRPTRAVVEVPFRVGRPRPTRRSEHAMKALTWQGKRDVRVETVPDPSIEQPTDAIIRVTSTGLCGSDLHLYEVLGPFLDAGDVLGHEPMGI